MSANITQSRHVEIQSTIKTNSNRLAAFDPNTIIDNPPANVGNVFNSNNPSRAIRTFAAMVATACVVIAVSSSSQLSIKELPVIAKPISTVEKIKVDLPDAYEAGRVKVHERSHIAESVLKDQIAKTWRISKDTSKKIVDLSFKEGVRSNVDPLILLSIIAVESSFNPKSTSSVGAEGVMQVWKKWHPEKFEAETAKDPIQKNIRIGIKVLQGNLKSSDNDFMEALQRYNGNKKDKTMKYANKVVDMHENFKDIYTSALSPKADRPVNFTLNDNYDFDRKKPKIQNS